MKDGGSLTHHQMKLSTPRQWVVSACAQHAYIRCELHAMQKVKAGMAFKGAFIPVDIARASLDVTAKSLT